MGGPGAEQPDELVVVGQVIRVGGDGSAGGDPDRRELPHGSGAPRAGAGRIVGRRVVLRRPAQEGAGPRAAGNVPVFGILERRGCVAVTVVPNVIAQTLLQETVKVVKRGSLGYTDK